MVGRVVTLAGALALLVGGPPPALAQQAQPPPAPVGLLCSPYVVSPPCTPAAPAGLPPVIMTTPKNPVDGGKSVGPWARASSRPAEELAESETPESRKKHKHTGIGFVVVGILFGVAGTIALPAMAADAKGDFGGVGAALVGGSLLGVGLLSSSIGIPVWVHGAREPNTIPAPGAAR